MKKITLLLFSFVVIANVFNAKAQEEVPKEILLGTLNNVAHLKLENDQATALIDYNKGFVDEVYEILDSDKEEKSKKKSMKLLGEKRENDLRDIIGKHKTNKYLKQLEDEMKPLHKKEKLFKQLP